MIATKGDILEICPPCIWGIGSNPAIISGCMNRQQIGFNGFK